MARAEDVFPPNNLPGSSANWGRQVVRRIELGERSELQLSQKVDNGLRANAGQLAVLADQMNELFERRNIFDWNRDQVDITGSGMSAQYVDKFSLIRFSTSEPRHIKVTATVNAVGYMDATGAAVSNPIALYYGFPSEPLSDWSNKVSASSGSYTLLSTGRISTPSGGGQASYQDPFYEVSYFSVLPGDYIFGTEAGVFTGVTSGSATVYVTIFPGGVSLSLEFSAPDPSITVSDIPPLV